MNKALLYILLWYVGAVQSLYIESSILSLSLSIPFMLLSCYYAYLTMTKYNDNKYIKILSILFIWLLFYGIFHLFFGEDVFLHYRVRRKTEFLLSILNSLGPIFAFYVLTIKGKLRSEFIVWLIIPFLVLTTLEYNKTIEDLATRFASTDLEEFTNNTGYIFISLAPLLFFINKKPLFQYLLLGYILFFTISSMKRGAILIGIIVLLWTVKQTFSLISKKKKIYICILSLSLLIVGINYIKNLFSTSAFFQLRVEQTMEGESSHRDVIYESLSKFFFQESDVLQLLFGYGADGTIAISGNLAHSDWLEILINCGIIGIVLYVIYWLSFFHEWIKNKQNKLVYSVLGVCIFYTFIKSLFSMSYDCMSFYMCMSIGYGMGLIYLIKHRKINEKSI